MVQTVEKVPQFHYFRHGTCRSFILRHKEGGNIVIIFVYVDYINLPGNDEAFVTNIVTQISRRFEVRIEEKIGTFLGISLEENSSSI